MKYAIILSGGVGTRLGANLPKQYLEVNNRTVLSYSLEAFQKHKDVDKIVIVASPKFNELILEDVKKHGITKFLRFADAGESRQHSILSGLKAIADNEVVSDDDVVLIHDGVRANVSEDIIDSSLSFSGYDGALPVINITDTIFYSEGGFAVESLLNRKNIFAGQTPESFLLKKYLACHDGLTDQEIASSTGGSQLAFSKGMNIKLATGKPSNYKITTIEDFEKFRIEKSK
jgi:2-C-methyl-D-erythritol 4-phosphate cytidylyltransferase